LSEGKNMRYLLIVLGMLLAAVTSAMAQVSFGIGYAVPGVSIGINLPMFPQFVQIPGYPVYYAPQLDSNFFFYDGLYWVYQGDNWYISSWYNGPWELVMPETVPLFILRIPVRYYRHPPAYFRGWRPDTPPRWGEHWGHEWEQRRSGWNQWNRHSAPAPAPLPTYQRRYSGDQYPRAEQQPALHNQNYRYQPRDAIVRQHNQTPTRPSAPAPSQREPQGGPIVPQEVLRSAPTQAPPRQRGPAAHDQKRPQQEREKDREKEEERVHERNR
jgi:hypothetical protein